MKKITNFFVMIWKTANVELKLLKKDLKVLHQLRVDGFELLRTPCYCSETLPKKLSATKLVSLSTVFNQFT